MPTTAPAPASPATQPTPLLTQATGRALDALPLLHLHPPILFQAVLLPNQNRQALRLLQWNADGLVTKQHELRLRRNDDSIDICLIQETKLLPKDTTGAGDSSHSFETI